MADKASKAAKGLWLLGAVLCAAYFAGAMSRSGLAFEALASLPKWTVLLWKAMAEILLVMAVWLTARTRLARILALSVTFIFTADMCLAVGQVSLAGGVFVIAHLLAMVAYLQFARKPNLKWTLKAVSLIPLGLVLLLLLWSVQAGQFQILVVFPIFSALAAFGAVRSIYPLGLNGLGTLIFWLSDMVFVVAILWWESATSVGWLVWLSFATGYLLIVRGLILKASSELKTGQLHSSRQQYS